MDPLAHARSRRPLVLAVALAAAACGSPSEPGGGDGRPHPAPELFDELWETVDREYSHFPVKQVEWPALGARWRAELDAASSDAELWTALTGLLGELRDVHVSLTRSLETTWRWEGWRDRPEYVDPGLVDTHYLQDVRETAHMVYGRLAPPRDDVGYVRIPSFGGSDWGGEIDAVLAGLPGVRALVIDVRSNGGGNDAVGRQIAGRFADRRRLFRIIRYRDGPEHDDYGPPIEDFLDPAGRRFDGPVALLTNRHVFSSAEGFVLMMRALPTVTTVGDFTGGSSGNPRTYLLPNAWRYTVPSWSVRTPDGQPLEDVGLPPDVLVRDPPAGTVDPLLEAALERLAQPAPSSS